MFFKFFTQFVLNLHWSYFIEDFCRLDFIFVLVWFLYSNVLKYLSVKPTSTQKFKHFLPYLLFVLYVKPGFSQPANLMFNSPLKKFIAIIVNVLVSFLWKFFSWPFLRFSSRTFWLLKWLFHAFVLHFVKLVAKKDCIIAISRVW